MWMCFSTAGFLSAASHTTKSTWYITVVHTVSNPKTVLYCKYNIEIPVRHDYFLFILFILLLRWNFCTALHSKGCIFQIHYDKHLKYHAFDWLIKTIRLQLFVSALWDLAKPVGSSFGSHVLLALPAEHVGQNEIPASEEAISDHFLVTITPFNTSMIKLNTYPTLSNFVTAWVCALCKHKTALHKVENERNHSDIRATFSICRQVTQGHTQIQGLWHI